MSTHYTPRNFTHVLKPRNRPTEFFSNNTEVSKRASPNDIAIWQQPPLNRWSAVGRSLSLAQQHPCDDVSTEFPDVRKLTDLEASSRDLYYNLLDTVDEITFMYHTLTMIWNLGI
jgi:hypothetical protein